jgi:hypothetical protein
MGLVCELFKTARSRNLWAACAIYRLFPGRKEEIDSAFAHDGRGKLG